MKPSMFFTEDAREFLTRCGSEYAQRPSLELGAVIDALIGLVPPEEIPDGYPEYVKQHKQRLRDVI